MRGSGVDGRVILKQIAKKQDFRILTLFNPFLAGSSGCVCKYGKGLSGSMKAGFLSS
jgi:hypothetical protein